MASAAGSLWVANLDDQSVMRVDTSTGRVLRSIAVGGTPVALAAAADAVWVSDDDGRILRLDPQYDRAVETRRLVAGVTEDRRGSWPMVVAFGSLWVVNPDGYVLRVDAETARGSASVDVGNHPDGIAAGAGSLWVTNDDDGTVTRIDPDTLVATTIPVGHGPNAVAVNAAGIWVANSGDDDVVRIDPETGVVAATTHVSDASGGLLATPTAVWVAGGRDGSVTRLDPASGAVIGVVHLGGSPSAVAPSAGHVWVAVAPAPPPSATSGGVARLTMQDDISSLDPALVDVRGSGRRVRDVCRLGHVPGRARARRLAHRAGDRRGGSDPDGRRTHLHVHHPPRVPVLAAVGPAGHRGDVQVDDRAGRRPAARLAHRPPCSTASSATTST